MEAARADEAGRGFAVVAEEVRNLALRSKEAARKTEVLIKDSVQLAQHGEGICQLVNANLEGVVTSVSKVSAALESISRASEEQARDINQLNRVVTQMDQITQQNAATSEESASSAEERSGQAEGLTALVNRFQLETPGEARRAAPRLASLAPARRDGRPPAARPRVASRVAGNIDAPTLLYPG